MTKLNWDQARQARQNDRARKDSSSNKRLEARANAILDAHPDRTARIQPADQTRLNPKARRESRSKSQGASRTIMTPEQTQALIRLDIEQNGATAADYPRSF